MGYTGQQKAFMSPVLYLRILFASVYVHKNDSRVLIGKTPAPEPPNFVERLSAFMTKHIWKYKPPKDAIPLDEHATLFFLHGYQACQSEFLEYLSLPLSFGPYAPS